MSTPTHHPLPTGSEAITRRLFLLGAIGPLTATSIGVDGGDIFQILAVETLRLDPRAVGAALLFGALSIPVQIWAARIPLQRARHNIRLYLWSMGLLTFVAAAVVAGAPVGSRVAGVVLLVAVIAEILVSVLYATAWQPLLSYALSVDQRQFINGRGRAASGIVLLVGAILFGELGRSGRALFIAALGVAAVAVGWSLHVLPPPPDPTEPDPADLDEQAPEASPSRSFTTLFLAFPAVAFASWPLLVSYAAVVLWPSGSLGLLAGAMVLGSIVASGLWRDPGGHLVAVIRVASVGVAVCSGLLVVLDSPVASDLGVVVLLAVVGVGGAARTVLRTAVMELAHRRIDSSNVVRVMTMLDVVGSTSFQVGGFIAGFLIARSVEATGVLDAYRIWLLASSLLLLVVVARFRPSDSGDVTVPASSRT